MDLTNITSQTAHTLARNGDIIINPLSVSTCYGYFCAGAYGWEISYYCVVYLVFSYSGWIFLYRGDRIYFMHLKM